ncbi:helix-turn-helix transcriptional regulator [Alkalimarinus coralli]|uniref:helix-turn-helix transcriptional regulator n=1 Tax=Alkalimarinus coralli TaxID=2935863 RepID=UPI00202AFF96|nr:YafY family protein [Alkalimarinus coralli]
MNRFDRVTAILIQLQTKRIVKAQELAEKHNVSLRTIYRDIRTLENAGVPIGSEAGIGYFLDKGYQLPPVVFSQEEASALLVGEKAMKQLNEPSTLGTYISALDKVKAVLSSSDKEYIETLSSSIDVYTPAQVSSHDEGGQWLPACKKALSHAVVMSICYYTQYREEMTERTIEPIGLYHYSRHWHMIAWCRVRQDYRDFRLDRIQSLTLQPEHFSRHRRKSLEEYLGSIQRASKLHQVKVRFRRDVAKYLGDQRYYFGLVSETQHENSIDMEFLTPSIEYFARWILSYTDAVEVLHPSELVDQMQRLVRELVSHFGVQPEH